MSPEETAPPSPQKLVHIRRYRNRKLYDVSAADYITLREVAALIGKWQQVKVTDVATGQDRTALTMAQALLALISDLGERADRVIPLLYQSLLLLQTETLPSFSPA